MRIVSLETIDRLRQQARGLRGAVNRLRHQARRLDDPGWAASTERLEVLMREHVGLLEAVIDALVDEGELAQVGRQPADESTDRGD